MKSKQVLLASVFLSVFVATDVAAQKISAVSINPFSGSQAVDSETSTNISGQCGPSVVRVLGITSINDDFFDIDQDGGLVIVRQPPLPEVHITPANGLSDHNGVACVKASGKQHLLIWANCGGSVCGDDFGFIVIAMDRPRIVSPKNCNELCAAKLTGSKLPYILNQKPIR